MYWLFIISCALLCAGVVLKLNKFLPKAREAN